MNTNNRLLHFLGVILLAFSCCNCASENENNDSSDGEEQTSDYFANVLAGKTTALNTDNTPIALSDIAAQQKAVWEEWVKANNAFDEDKLPETKEKLGNGKTGSWPLPAKLEPNATMPFYWGTKGDKPNEGYPLYIHLHGSGPKDVEWLGGFNNCNGYEDAPSLYFIPQIPNEGQNYRYYRWYQRAKQFAWERLFRLAFLDEEINPNRFYFIGISEGAYGSQRLASFYADYLAGAGPVAGGEQLHYAPAENCRHIAFYLLTGEKDTDYGRDRLTMYAKEEFDRLEKEHPGDYVHNIGLDEGQIHETVHYGFATPWLKNYTRNLHPKAFTWENFDMDGIYRDAFYNLVVLKRSDESRTRSCYDMKIENNRIDLNVNLVSYTVLESKEWNGTTIKLKFEKTYKPATKGKVLIYLNDKLVDLSKEVTLVINGTEVFKGMVQPEMRHLINSCATFYDPARLYPAAIEAEIK